MPSRALGDCVLALADAWRTIEEAYARAHPDRALLLTCTYRSPAEQFALFQKGRLQTESGLWILDADPATQIVTNCDGRRGRSKHNHQPSSALDFCVLIAGKVSWHAAEYEAAGAIGERLGLVWGGRWSSIKDYPHLEMPQ